VTAEKRAPLVGSSRAAPLSVRVRHAAAVAATIALLAGVIELARVVPPSTDESAAQRPAVPEFRADAKASTWFCAGVPGNDDSISGRVIVANSGEVPVGGTITRFAQDGVARRQRFAVAARSTLEVDALAGVESRFVSTLVESQGAALAVEQRTLHRAGDAVSQCASSPSGTWFLADGFTGTDSIEQLVVTNPALDSAILDVTFVTAIGERAPQSLKGVVVPPESVRVFDMAALDARNEATVAVSVVATVGRVVVGRSQHYLGRGRLGYTMSLGASETSDRWYFADGTKRAEVAEEFVIYNPLTFDQQLTFIVAADDGTALDPLTITAPAKRVTKFAPTSLGALPDGRYSAVVSAMSVSAASVSASRPAGVVIERVSTQQVGKSTASALMLGTPQPAVAWVAPSGTAASGVESLRVFNPGAASATLRVTYLGPAGAVAVPGYEAVVLAPGASASIALSAETAATAVSVESNEPVVVARRVSRGAKQAIEGVAPLIVVTGAASCAAGEGC
jgi:P pilus assembly chaperone PapD